MSKKTKQIFEKLFENIDKNTLLYEMIPYLENYEERIEFFKIDLDYNDPIIDKDFLILLEKSEDYILKRNLNEETSPIDDFDISNFTNISMSKEEILFKKKDQLIKELDEFFNETKEVLYVSISFESQIVSDRTNWELFEKIDGMGYSRSDLLKMVLDKTKYPEWYNPMYEKDLDLLSNLFNVVSEIERIKLKKYVTEIDEAVKESLLKDDFETAKKLSDILSSTEEEFI